MYESVNKHMLKWAAKGKISMDNDLNFSLFLTQSYCMTSEDLDISKT